MAKWFSPTGIIWIITHILLVVLGAVFLSAKWFADHLGPSISEGVGGSLIATGIAGEFLFLYIRATDSTQSKIEMITDAGLKYIFAHRSIRIKTQYDVRLARASKIDLVAYGLSSFREDYQNHFATWSYRARVRILLLDPDFPTSELSLADQRDKEEGHPAGKTRGDIEKFESIVSNLPGLNRKNFELRRFRAIPAINLLRIDNEIFWGPYLIGQQSRNTPTLLVGRDGYLFETLQSHFEQLWEGSVAIPIKPQLAPNAA